MPRGSSPEGPVLPNNEPPRMFRKKLLTIDLVKLVKDQKTRKGLDYVIQAIDNYVRYAKSDAENLELSEAIEAAEEKFPENTKKRTSELPLSDVIMYLNRKDDLDKTLNAASVGVLVGLLVYASESNQYDKLIIQSIMTKIINDLGEEPKPMTLYDSGITTELINNFLAYLDNFNEYKLQNYFTNLKFILLNTENVKSIAAAATERERTMAKINQIRKNERERFAAGIKAATRFNAIRKNGSLTESSNENCNKSGSCAISGGKRKIRKSRKASSKSRKTRRRK